jgi:hypothetical protein
MNSKSIWRSLQQRNKTMAGVPTDTGLNVFERLNIRTESWQENHLAEKDI